MKANNIMANSNTYAIIINILHHFKRMDIIWNIISHIESLSYGIYKPSLLPYISLSKAFYNLETNHDKKIDFTYKLLERITINGLRPTIELLSLLLTSLRSLSAYKNCYDIILLIEQYHTDLKGTKYEFDIPFYVYIQFLHIYQQLHLKNQAFVIYKMLYNKYKYNSQVKKSLSLYKQHCIKENWLNQLEMIDILHQTK